MGCKEKRGLPMLAFAVSLTPIPPPPPLPPPPSAIVNHLSTTNFPSHGFKSRRLSLLKSPPPKLSPRRNLFAVYAAENGDRDVTSADNGKGKRENGLNSNGGGKGNNGRPKLNLRWVDLLLDPDPENIVAVGLTGVLAWASVQILLQLFGISLAILIAALKYSFIAALLIFILITLL